MKALHLTTSKITRLSPTDLANIATLPIEKRHSALLQIEKPKVYWGYDPVRSSLPALLLAESSLPLNLKAGNDEHLIKSVGQKCKSGPIQKSSNMAVARSIVEWRKQHVTNAVIVQSEPYRTSADSLKFCADVVPIVGGRPVIVNLDPRSEMHLVGRGKEFIKSLIHHTAKIGDLRDARVGILRTPKAGKGLRSCILEELNGTPIYSLDELEERIIQTYSIWETVLRGRRNTAQSEKSGQNDLFG